MQASAALLQDTKQDFAGDILAANNGRYNQLTQATAEQTITNDRKVLFAIAAGSLDLMSARAAEFAALVKGNVSSISPKDPEKGDRKIDNEYDGVCKLLCDPVRATVIIPPDNIEMCRAVLALHESTKAVKDLIANPSKTGLAILNAKIELPNGLVGEIQFVTPHMHEAMHMTHGSYKKIDSLTSAFAHQAMPAEVSSEINRLRADCVDSHATGAFLDGLVRYVDKTAAKAHSPLALVN